MYALEIMQSLSDEELNNLSIDDLLLLRTGLMLQKRQAERNLLETQELYKALTGEDLED